MLLSSTMYADASMCLKRYEYRWIDQLVRKPQDVGVALRRGIWIHKCLEEFHKGSDWLVALHEMAEWADEHGVDQEKVSEITSEVIGIMQGYIDYWRGKQTWEVLGAEYPAIVRFDGESGIRATIDLAVRWQGQDWLVEHKSTGEIPPASWRAVDPQTALQYWLCHATKPVIGGRVFEPVGIIFNYLLTKVPSVPWWKKDGTLYANATPTTSAAFDKGLDAAGFGPGDPTGERTKLVNDSLFYRRFPIQRPDDNVRETMQDIIATLHDLRTAQIRNHYRRSLHVLTCRRFCTYSELCVHEYTIGKKSEVMRNELFMLDDGSRGEGR